MNVQVTENEVNIIATAAVACRAAKEQADRRNALRIARSTSTGVSKTRTKSKRNQLVALLSKPSGTRISVLVERLGWQAHTVRAAVSGLRKQGFDVVTSKSPKTGETVYAIVAPSNGDRRRVGNGAAS